MKKVLLLLADGYESYEASVFIDVIGWNLIDGDKTTRLFTCGLRKELTTSFGQKMIVDYVVDEIRISDFDALAIPGGFEEYDFYSDAYSEPFLDIIRKFNAQNKIIASICVAALALGKSGILKGKRATTYNKKSIRQELLRSYGAIVVDKPVVRDGTILTCWNPSAAIQVAFALLESLTDRKNTLKALMEAAPKNLYYSQHVEGNGKAHT